MNRTLSMAVIFDALRRPELNLRLKVIRWPAPSGHPRRHWRRGVVPGHLGTGDAWSPGAVMLPISPTT
jgi:hypothetical protein